MDVIAITRYARLSPNKARDLVGKVRGLPVGEALKITQFSPRKAATLLGRTLKSAIANAENNAHLAVDDLKVKNATIEEGPRMRRHWPRARGAVSPILKRMCHIRVVLTDGKDEASA